MPKHKCTHTRRSSRRAQSNPIHTVSKDDSLFALADEIVNELKKKANPQTKAWFTNYVKNTEWIGCKVPIVRGTVQQIKREGGFKDSTNAYLLDNGIHLLQHPACDAKLAGMIILNEHIDIDFLAAPSVLDRFDRDIWKTDNTPCHIADWSSADWFAARVLSKIAFSSKHDLADRILQYTTVSCLWQRRCGVVSFLKYQKHRDKLPLNFGIQLVAACETNLLCSPEERFTQTGIAWVLRYMLVQNDHKEEQEACLAMIQRNGAVWTKEAKKSLVEKMTKSDPRRKMILEELS